MSHGPALAHELSARYLSPLLHVVLPRVDRADLDAFLAPWEVTLADLQDDTNWVSLRFCEALTEWMAQRVPIEELERETTRYIFLPSTMGFIYAVLRAVGSPRQVYASLPKVGAVLNKVSTVTVEEVRRGAARITYSPRTPELAEHSELICRIRKAQLVAGPTLWGLPLAQLTELQCQAKGHGACRYELRWSERAGFWGTALGLAAGVTAGAAFPLPAAAGAALVVAGGALGRLWDQYRQLQDFRRFSDEQAAALHDSVAAAERRFLDVQEAKGEVEKKVDERTRELHEALRKLEELTRVKDEFLANVSHELRTPLTLILAPLEHLLSEPDLPAQVGEQLRPMHRASVRLLAMVNDLLELARLQAGHLRLAVQDTDVLELASAAREQFLPLAQRKGVELHLEIPSTRVRAWLDAGRMEFVIDNLLSNALKFTPAGGHITLRVEEAPGTVTLSVQDTGAGIPAEHLDHVFERFARFDNPLAPGAAGAGIGLALVRGVVELHGGKVELESAAGKGTTVRLRLPLDKEHFDPEVLDRRRVDVPVPFGRRSSDRMDLGMAAVSASEPAVSELPTPPPGAPTVLVVEDNDDLRAFLVRSLSRFYRVEQAPDGAAALQLIARHPPQGIISDVMMPNLSGDELARRLKSDPATRRIPILLVTARKGTERMLESLESADDYLVKPFNERELLARLDVQLRLRRLMDEQVQAGKLVQLGTLAAGMAHEVNNPAGAILGMLRKLRRDMDGKVEPRWLRAVDTSLECAERITRLVQDLLELGQPNREGMRAWDVREGLQAALRVLDHRMPAGVKVECHLPELGPVRARPAEINQVFLNLLDNALKAVGEQGTITVETRARDGGVEVSVADSGAGIAPEHLPRVFDPFFTTRAPGQGTGLGLHLSQRIVREHAGKLEVVSTPGQGACFSVWLPAAPAAADTEPMHGGMAC